MDLNSYLTDFFSMINNNNSIFGGNGYMRGGKKPDGVTFGEGLTNDQILEYYFDKPGSTFKPSVDNSDKLIFKNNTLKKEFIEHQVGIVEYMLDKTQTIYGGGMYGGGPLEDELAAAEQDFQTDPSNTTFQARKAAAEAAIAAEAARLASAAAAVTADPSAGTPPDHPLLKMIKDAGIDPDDFAGKLNFTIDLFNFNGADDDEKEDDAIKCYDKIFDYIKIISDKKDKTDIYKSLIINMILFYKIIISTANKKTFQKILINLILNIKNI